MTEEIYDYDVRCTTCFNKFTVQLFESHEKNLWLVDNKEWHCEPCKKAYFEKQAADLAKSQSTKGFQELTGTLKQKAWAEKIRAELLNKVDFLKESLSFTDPQEEDRSNRAFEAFIQEWQQETKAKWWIENRNTTVRDISTRVTKLLETIK